jgi:NADPH:quinone reductase
MAPTTQKALEVHALKEPLVLVNDRTVLEPGSGEVRIQVTVAGINPHDNKSRDIGLFIGDKLPAVLTNDVVGRVEKVGSDVSNLKVGDRVVSQANWTKGSPSNGLQEYAVLEAQFVSKIPDKISDDGAATLPTNALPALVAFYGPKGFRLPAPWTSPDLKNEAIFIIGGGSNCGRFAVQLAALGGVGTVVVLGGDEAELKSYGATTVLDRTGSPEEVAARIRKVFPDGVKYVFDAINPPATQYVGINALTESGGKYARLLPLGPPSPEHIKRTDYELVNVFGSSHAVPDVSREFWAHLSEYLESGKIVPTEYTTIEGLDADAVNKVLDDYRAGNKVTKTHVHIS